MRIDSYDSDSSDESEAGDDSSFMELSYLATKRPPIAPPPRSPPVSYKPASKPASHPAEITNNPYVGPDAVLAVPPVQKAQGSKKALAFYASIDHFDLRPSFVNLRASLSELAANAPSQHAPIASTSKLASKTVKERQAELEDITSLLENMAVSRAKETAAMHAAFEQRNKTLWETIEGAIAAKEAEARAAQQREAQLLAQARAKQQAAEKAAKEAKDKALKEEQELQEASKRQEAERAEREAKAAKDNVAKQRFLERHQTIKKLKQVGPAVLANAEWRKACREAKKVITPRVGQVTNSQSHIRTIVCDFSLRTAAENVEKARCTVPANSKCSFSRAIR